MGQVSQHLPDSLLHVPVVGGKTVMAGGKGGEGVTNNLPHSETFPAATNTILLTIPLPATGPGRPGRCSALILGSDTEARGLRLWKFTHVALHVFTFQRRALELKGAIHEVCLGMLCAQRVGVWVQPSVRHGGKPVCTWSRSR